MNGRIHSFESFGALDGPGIRCVVFLQGCPLRCLCCHNPDSRPFLAGTEVSASELMKRIRSIRNFIRSGGVTLSGGEPTAQMEFAMELLALCRAEGIHTALDTAAPYPVSRTRPLIDAADMLLLDIKAADEDVCLRVSGNTGRNAWETLKYCEQTGKRVWIRHVLIPGLTMREDPLRKLADALRPFRCVEKTELLPFHKLGEEKWKALGWKYELYDTPVPTEQELAAARELFSRA